MTCLSAFVDQFFSAYLDLAGIPVTTLSVKTATPFVDETNACTNNEPGGKLANIPLKVLMKIPYSARH